jgi:hypothetical protein
VTVVRRHPRLWRIDGVIVSRVPRLYGSLPRDHRLEDPDTRALWQQRIDEELVGEVIVHPQLREREPWMTTMGDLRGTWGYGLILFQRYKCTDYDRFIDMVCLTVRNPLQVAWCRSPGEERGATLLNGFRLPVNLETGYA